LRRYRAGFEPASSPNTCFLLFRSDSFQEVFGDISCRFFRVTVPTVRCRPLVGGESQSGSRRLLTQERLLLRTYLAVLSAALSFRRWLLCRFAWIHPYFAFDPQTRSASSNDMLSDLHQRYCCYFVLLEIESKSELMVSSSRVTKT
jgi:hypothetical protein